MDERLTKDQYFLKIAEDVAKRSTCLKRNYGAVIVKDDRIVSTGYNGAPRGKKNCTDIGTCPRMNVPNNTDYTSCRSVHAEMNAIIHANYTDMQDAVLYLYGFDCKTNETVKDCTPCPMCKRSIINAGIKCVVVPASDMIMGYRCIPVAEWVYSDEPTSVITPPTVIRAKVDPVEDPEAYRKIVEELKAVAEKNNVSIVTAVQNPEPNLDVLMGREKLHVEAVKVREPETESEPESEFANSRDYDDYLETYFDGLMEDAQKISKKVYIPSDVKISMATVIRDNLSYFFNKYNIHDERVQKEFLFNVVYNVYHLNFESKLCQLGSVEITITSTSEQVKYRFGSKIIMKEFQPTFYVFDRYKKYDSITPLENGIRELYQNTLTPELMSQDRSAYKYYTRNPWTSTIKNPPANYVPHSTLTF